MKTFLAWFSSFMQKPDSIKNLGQVFAIVLGMKKLTELWVAFCEKHWSDESLFKRAVLFAGYLMFVTVWVAIVILLILICLYGFAVGFTGVVR